jgi:hypothetical protein
VLAPQAQRLAAGDDGYDSGARLQQPAQLRPGLKDVLRVVQQEQPPVVAQHPGEALADRLAGALMDTQRPPDGGEHVRGGVDASEVDERHAAGERGAQLLRRLEREAGLADAPRAGHGQQPHAVLSHQAMRGLRFRFASHQRAQGPRGPSQERPRRDRSRALPGAAARRPGRRHHGRGAPARRFTSVASGHTSTSGSLLSK